MQANTSCKFAKGCNDMICVNHCGFRGLDRDGLPKLRGWGCMDFSGKKIADKNRTLILAVDGSTTFSGASTVFSGSTLQIGNGGGVRG